MTDPCPISLEERKRLMKEVAREEFELIGLRVESAESREDVRKDMAFLRSLRERMDAVASKIGYAVIVLVGGGLLALMALGVQFKIGPR